MFFKFLNDTGGKLSTTWHSSAKLLPIQCSTMKICLQMSLVLCQLMTSKFTYLHTIINTFLVGHLCTQTLWCGFWQALYKKALVSQIFLQLTNILHQASHPIKILKQLTFTPQKGTHVYSTLMLGSIEYTAVVQYRIHCCGVVQSTLLWCSIEYTAVVQYRIHCCGVVQNTLLWCSIEYTDVVQYRVHLCWVVRIHCCGVVQSTLL